MKCYFFFLIPFFLSAHCQMPCGIYNDQMVYDRVTEYYLTMYKAVKALEHNPMKTVDDFNTLVRWVMTKERLSDEIAELLSSYFLQQKIKPLDANVQLVQSIHRLLCQVVVIKQNVDIKLVEEFNKEWEHFKTLFHPDKVCESKEEEHTHEDGTVHSHH